nr:MAG TPA: Glycine rich protein family [Caudoviricetes sp.]
MSYLDKKRLIFYCLILCYLILMSSVCFTASIYNCMGLVAY